jgi:hypothetical protein
VRNTAEFQLEVKVFDGGSNAAFLITGWYYN